MHHPMSIRQKKHIHHRSAFGKRRIYIGRHITFRREESIMQQGCLELISKRKREVPSPHEILVRLFRKNEVLMDRSYADPVYVNMCMYFETDRPYRCRPRNFQRFCNFKWEQVCHRDRTPKYGISLKGQSAEQHMYGWAAFWCKDICRC